MAVKPKHVKNGFCERIVGVCMLRTLAGCFFIFDKIKTIILNSNLLLGDTHTRMAFQTKAPPTNNRLGASLGPAAGQSAEPPGDALSSQLPVKVYSGNKSLFFTPGQKPVILHNSSHIGYFSSAAMNVGVRAVPLNPLTWTGEAPTGGPSGGQTGGTPAPAKKKKSILKGKLLKGSMKEAIAAKQLTTGRASSTKTSTRASQPLPRSSTLRLYKNASMSRPYIPRSLGGGTLIRLPRA